jgi:hypothetical protein
VSATVEVPLRGRDGGIRAVAIVDVADAEVVLAHRWNLADGYASRSFREGGVVKTELLHRFLMGLRPGDARQVDHRNLDRLDCRRANMRVVTKAQNQQNLAAGGVPGTSSRYRGVSWNKATGRWRAQAKVAGRKHWLGDFHDEDEAGRVAAAFRAAHMPFALN